MAPFCCDSGFHQIMQKIKCAYSDVFETPQMKYGWTVHLPYCYMDIICLWCDDVIIPHECHITSEILPSNVFNPAKNILFLSS